MSSIRHRIPALLLDNSYRCPSRSESVHACTQKKEEKMTRMTGPARHWWEFAGNERALFARHLNARSAIAAARPAKQKITEAGSSSLGRNDPNGLPTPFTPWIV